MAVEYYRAKKEIQDQVQALIGQHHPDLASLNKGEIVVVFREKAAKSGGQVLLGASRKAAPLMNALAGENFVFILELAQDEWSDLTSVHQEALLDHLLCGCRAEEDAKSGNWKFTIAKPDVMAYGDNIRRYGFWFPKEEGDDDSTPDAVQDMFGDKDGEE